MYTEIQRLKQNGNRINIPTCHDFGRISKKAYVIPSLSSYNGIVYRVIILFDPSYKEFPDNHLLKGNSRESRRIRRRLFSKSRLEKARTNGNNLSFRLDNWFISYLGVENIVVSYVPHLREEVVIMTEEELRAIQSHDLLAELEGTEFYDMFMP